MIEMYNEELINFSSCEKENHRKLALILLGVLGVVADLTTSHPSPSPSPSDLLWVRVCPSLLLFVPQLTVPSF